MTDPSDNLENKIQGTWWLLSREDYTKDGQRLIDPILGADPLAILVYANNHFAAQFMKKTEMQIQSPEQLLQDKIILLPSEVTTPTSEPIK
jgi:hypothetical protein